MFRRRKSSFSITTFMNNAIPNLGADPYTFAYCPNTGQDLLHAHQMASRNPYAFDERSIFVSGIVDKEGPSRTAFHKLQKHGILDAQGNINTMAIGRNFTHQLAVLDQRRQRMLIDLLFWWEEECHRLRKLKDEEQHLSKTVKAIEKRGYNNNSDGLTDGERNNRDEDDRNGATTATVEDADYIPDDDLERRQLLDHLRFEREKVRMRMRQKPSQRRADVEAGTDTLSHQISGRVYSVPNVHLEGSSPLQMSKTTPDAKISEPPAYRP